MNMFDDTAYPGRRQPTITATFPQGLLAKPDETIVSDPALHRMRPILVTGAPFSGTRWVSHLLNQSRDTVYLHEPFDLRHDPGLLPIRFTSPFPYLTPRDAEAGRAIGDMLAFRYKLIQGLRASGTINKTAPAMIAFVRSLGHRLAKHRALIKANSALFSADYLHRKFNMDVVVVIRHPAAIAGSIKVAEQRTPFEAFLNQPALMREHLSPFDATLRKYSMAQPDIVDEAILLWRMFHLVIMRYVHYHPNWIFVRHEDLSRDPLMGFSRLYRALGLEYTAAIQRQVEEHSSSRHAATGRNEHTIRRNSMANLHTWSRRLTDSEILRIKEGTEDFSSHFYNEADWLHA